VRPPSLSPLLAGSLAALAATVIWAGNFVVARGLADALPPGTLALGRWGTATLLALPLTWRALRAERAAIRAHLPYLLLTSLLGVTVFNTLIYVAGHYTTALNMALVCSFIPAMLMLLSRIFLGEALSPARVAGLVTACAGVALLLAEGRPARLLEFSPNPGDLWMLLAALLFAAYSILVRRRPEGISRSGLLGSSFALGVLMLLPWAAAEQVLGMPTDLTGQAVGGVLYVGLGASLAAYWLWNLALDTIGPARAGVIYYALPLFSGIEAALLLGEPITWVHAASGALIIGGIGLALRHRA
jgi:drug/metabolite transporter (DMT)-like permease